MAVFLGITIGVVTDLAYGLQLNYFGGYLVQGLLAGAAISVVFGAVGVSDRPVPLAVPWAFVVAAADVLDEPAVGQQRSHDH